MGTNHDMPASMEEVKKYVEGKNYMKRQKWYSQDFSQFLPDIVPHKTLKKHLFCTLTRVTIPMQPEKVQNHMNGGKFKEAKAAKDERRRLMGEQREKRSKGKGKEEKAEETEDAE